MLTLLTDYPDRERALVLALVNGFVAYDEATGASLSRSCGRRKTGRSGHYYLHSPTICKWLTAASDEAAVAKANKFLT